MTALTRMAVMLRIYTDDLRERREQGTRWSAGSSRSSPSS
jgi:hypothetical protein